MPGSVRAVERALDILLSFTQKEPDLSLTQIAERVGIHKSTAHRLLATLESKRFVNRHPSDGTYHLALRFIEMASVVLQDVDLQRWARPYLQELVTECGETVDLCVLDGRHVVYLDVVDSSRRVKIAAAVGQRLPVACTASGKAFLAYLPEAQVRAILQHGFHKYTDHTLLTWEALAQDLRQTRERGFAVSEQEFEVEINAVAAPILDAAGLPVAAVAVVGPTYRLPRPRMLEIGERVCQVTQGMAREVGMNAISEIVSRTLVPTGSQREPGEG